MGVSPGGSTGDKLLLFCLENGCVPLTWCITWILHAVAVMGTGEDRKKSKADSTYPKRRRKQKDLVALQRCRLQKDHLPEPRSK